MSAPYYQQPAYAPPPAYAQPPPPVQVVPAARDISKDIAKRIKVLSVPVCLFGFLILVLESSAIGISSSSGYILYYYYSGIWGGLLYIAAGIVAIISSNYRKDSGWMAGAIFTTIFASITGFFVIIFEAVVASVCSVLILGDLCSNEVYAMHCVNAAFSAVNFVLCIVLSSNFCCHQQSSSVVVTTTSIPTVYANMQQYQYPAQPTVVTTKQTYG